MKLILTILISLLCLSQASYGGQWTGTLADGTIITVAKLEEIQQEHEKWLNNLDAKRADFSGANLAGAKFNGSFEGADFRHANLTDAVFSRASYDLADFRNATLTRAKFNHIDFFGGVRFQHATLNDVTFQGVRTGKTSTRKWTFSQLKEMSLKVNTYRKGLISFKEANLRNTHLGLPITHNM